MLPKTQLLVATVSISSLLSVVLLITMIFSPPGFAWAFLLLLQSISTYCGYQLYKQKAFKWAEIYAYLKNTKV